MVNVSGSMSAKTGTAFWCKVTAALEITVNAGEITSSPGPTPGRRQATVQGRSSRVVRDGVANAETLRAKASSSRVFIVP